MNISRTEKDLLRDLAKRVAEIAAHPRHRQRAEMWKKHNRLEKVKPMVLVFPEGSWCELLPDSVLQVSDPFWRHYEWHLRHLIYRWEHLRDDNVIDPTIRVGLVHANSGWGLPIESVPSPKARGAWGFKPAILEPEDAEKMKVPEIQVDEKQTQENYAAVNEVLGDILPVRLHRRIWVNTSLIGILARLRGLDQIMVDMCDRPQWVHRVMSFMAEATERMMDQIEQMGALELNNGADYVGSGGVGYTNELPQPDFDGKHVRWRDLWGFAEAQEFELVSPQMLEEFVVQYQARLLKRFGLNCYGCCETLTHKFGVVKQIPHLRRISIGPRSPLRPAAEALEDKYILSWKPNPAELARDFDPERIRRILRQGLEVTKGCVVEVILKDLHTVNEEPYRLTEWVKIAQALSETM